MEITSALLPATDIPIEPRIEVYPDFYAALLFSKLMGPEVLAATVTTGVQYSPKAYAHCAREKG